MQRVPKAGGPGRGKRRTARGASLGRQAVILSGTSRARIGERACRHAQLADQRIVLELALVRVSRRIFAERRQQLGGGVRPCRPFRPAAA